MDEIHQQPVGTAENEFAATLDRHLQAISSRDLAVFEATIDEEVRLVGTDGNVIEGRVDAVEAHRQWFADPSWRFDPYVMFSDTKDGVGWALAKVRYEAGAGTSELYLFLLFTLDDADGLWRLSYDQGTVVKNKRSQDAP